MAPLTGEGSRPRDPRKAMSNLTVYFRPYPGRLWASEKTVREDARPPSHLKQLLLPMRCPFQTKLFVSFG